MKKQSHACAILLLVACMVPAEVHESSRGKTIECKDTRDGEVFRYRANDVRNIRRDLFGPMVSFTVTDTESKVRHLNRQMEAYLKCAEVTDP